MSYVRPNYEEGGQKIFEKLKFLLKGRSLWKMTYSGVNEFLCFICMQFFVFHQCSPLTLLTICSLFWWYKQLNLCKFVFLYFLYEDGLKNEDNLRDLSGQAACHYLNSWSIAVKLAWECPRSTKTYLLQQVLACGGTSARVNIMARYTRFFQGLYRSPCQEVSILAGTGDQWLGDILAWYSPSLAVMDGQRA